MNKVFRNIFCVLVTLLYISSYMGFGIHECKTDGTKDLILMVGDTSCEAIHTHSHEHLHSDSGVCHTHSHICDQHHGVEADCCECNHSGSHLHSSDCCNTNVYVVSDVQNSSSDTLVKVFAPELSLESVFIVAETVSPALVAELNYDPAPLISDYSSSFLSVWRL
ncbi:MAG: hypothetical protein PHD11_05925 [Bacteroidales bacterium]|nr:hypothetical protein [Bacteroidales bacterium]MDD4670488.1 hypothetical protein [Bacteroidales bacterium]